MNSDVTMATLLCKKVEYINIRTIHKWDIWSGSCLRFDNDIGLRSRRSREESMCGE